MLPPWLDARYAGYRAEPAHRVPRWDPLRRDLLPKDFPELEHVTPWDEPIFQHITGATTAQYLISWSLFAFLGMHVLRYLGGVLASPLLSPLWFVVAVGVFIAAMRRGDRAAKAATSAAIIPLAFAAVLLGDAATSDGPARLGSLAAALALLVLLIDSAAAHRLNLLLAEPAAPENRRRAALEQWSARFHLTNQGASPYLLGFAPALLAALLSLFSPPVVVLFILPMAVALLLLGALHSYALLPRVLPALGDALEAWVHYGTRGEGAPGVLTTVAGARAYRLFFPPVVFLALSATLAPSTLYLTTFHALFAGDARSLWASVLDLLGTAFLPAVVITATAVSSIAPVLLSVEGQSPQSRDAGEEGAQRWDTLVARLQRSSQPLHRRQLLIGFHATEHYPVLLPVKTLQEHAHILGGSGAGKTSRAFLPLVSQLVRFPKEDARRPSERDNIRGPVVVVDLKGEPYLFQAVRDEAQRAGRTFRYFTNVPGRTTHAFNPVLDLKTLGLPASHVATSLHAALNLEHGTGYGRGYYSAVTRGYLQELLTENPDVRSLRELSEVLQRRRATRQSEKKREEEAYELTSSLNLLARRDELNVTERSGHRADVAADRIRMDRVIADDEVVYFYLVTHGDEAGARFIASLALECLYTAAIRAQEHSPVGDPKPVYILVDEFHMVAGRNFGMFLQLARSAGLALILSNQSRESLRQSELLHALDENTAFRQFFTARTPETLEYLEDIAGSTFELDDTDPRSPLKQRKASRLSRELLITLSAQPDLALAVQTINRDYAVFDGFPIALRAPYHISDRTRRTLSERAWPEAQPGTLTLETGDEQPRAWGPSPEQSAAVEALLARIRVSVDGYTFEA